MSEAGGESVLQRPVKAGGHTDLMKELQYPLWSFQSLLLELFLKTSLKHQDPGNLFVLLGAVSGLR